MTKLLALLSLIVLAFNSCQKDLLVTPQSREEILGKLANDKDLKLLSLVTNAPFENRLLSIKDRNGLPDFRYYSKRTEMERRYKADLEKRYKIPSDEVNSIISEAIMDYRMRLIEDQEKDDWRLEIVEGEIFNLPIEITSFNNPIDTAYVDRVLVDFGPYYRTLEDWIFLLDSRGCFDIARRLYIEAKRHLDNYGPYRHALNELELRTALTVLDLVNHMYQSSNAACTQSLENPTDPIGGGSGNGPTIPTVPAPPPTPLVLTFTECNAVSTAYKFATNPELKRAVDQIKNKNVEWGANIKLELLNNINSIKVDPAYTNNSESNIKPMFSWDPNRGYHIGFIHNHPSQSAPSPSDIYNAALSYADLGFGYATPQEIANYIVSFNSNIVSGDYIYTITIKNAYQFGLMKDSFNNNVERKRYENLTKKYLTDNFLGEPTAEQIQAAGESALLQLYGDQVHITKRKINDPKSIKVLKRQNKKVTSTNGC